MLLAIFSEQSCCFIVSQDNFKNGNSFLHITIIRCIYFLNEQRPGDLEKNSKAVNETHKEYNLMCFIWHIF